MDGERFGQEVHALLPNLYATALRFERNAADAEDLVAEAVSKAWCALHTLHDATRFRSWILRILTNTYFAQRRAGSALRWAEALPDEDAADFLHLEDLHQPFLLLWVNPEQQLVEGLLRRDLEMAIDALPDPFRSVVVLVDLEGLRYTEVAEALHVPVGTVRSRLARGRGMMQKVLWRHARDSGLVSTDARPDGPELP